MVTMTKPEWVCQRILAIYRYKARVEPNFGLGINDKFKEALIDTIYCLFSKHPSNSLWLRRKPHTCDGFEKRKIKEFISDA